MSDWDEPLSRGGDPLGFDELIQEDWTCQQCRAVIARGVEHDCGNRVGEHRSWRVLRRVPQDDVEFEGRIIPQGDKWERVGLSVVAPSEQGAILLAGQGVTDPNIFALSKQDLKRGNGNG